MTKRKRKISNNNDNSINQLPCPSLELQSSKKQQNVLKQVHTTNKIDKREMDGFHGKVDPPPPSHPNTPLKWRLLSMCKAMETFLRKLILDPPPAGVVNSTGIPNPFHLSDAIDYFSLQQQLIPLSWATLMHEIHWLSQQTEETLPDKYAIDVLLYKYRQEKETFESKRLVAKTALFKTKTSL